MNEAKHLDVAGFVIHVGSETERRKHMDGQMKKTRIHFTYMLDGDKKDLSPEILEWHFHGRMKTVCAETSCAYKHILAYRDMVEKNLPYGLIVEDDIFLHPDFDTALANAMEEISRGNIKNFLLSLEDSLMRYVEHRRRKKGVTVYKQEDGEGRCAGAYLIDLECARTLMREILEKRCDMTIDWFHTHCAKNGLIGYYWLHPTIATQGSHNGKMASLLSDKTGTVARRLSVGLQKMYKKILFRLR